MSQIGSVEKGPLSHTTYSTFGRQTLSMTDDKVFELPKMKCRICLQQSNPHFLFNQQFIKPCKCKGAQQFAHQSCIREWLNKLIKDRQELGVQIEKVNCELCNQEVSFGCKNTLRCLTQKERSRKFQVYWPLLVIYSIVIVVCMGALGWVIYTYSTLSKLTVKQKQTLIAVTVTTSIIVPVCVILCIYKLVDRFLIKREKNIIDVKSQPFKVEIRQKMSQNFNNSINPETQSELIRRRIKVVVNQPIRNRNISAEFLAHHQSLPQGVSLAPQTFFF